MPYTRPIEDLKNYEEISELCHKLGEPVFITKDGNIDAEPTWVVGEACFSITVK